jgi:hypothetical protein
MITQGYLNSEIDLAKRVYIYYTDKLLDILEAGNNDYQQWYRDSIQINYFLKALLAINLIDDRIYIGSGEVNKEFVVGLGASIREFLDYELKEIVIFGEQVLPDPINPPSPPIIIIKETTRLHWEYFDILITVDDPTTVALPFDIYVADRNSLMVTVNDNDPDNLVTPEEEGCHIIASTLYWHNYYELKTGDHLYIRFERIHPN